MNDTIKEISVEDIEDLQGLYSVIETNDLALENEHDITDLLVRYRNKSISDEEKQIVQWEIEVSLFTFNGNSLFSFSSSNGKEIGEVVQYPQIDAQQQNAFDYLKHRAHSSNSDLLKARYNHLLWKSAITKNTSYAVAATDSYLNVIERCLDQFQSGIADYSFLVGRLFENLVGIVSEVKTKVDETKKLAQKILFEVSNISFWLRHGIIDDMLKYPKIFKPDDFKNTLSLFEERLEQTESKGDDFLLVNNHIPTAIKVAQKQKIDVRRWYDEIGFAYLRMAEKETEEARTWIKLDEYSAAIDAFRQSGNLEKKSEVEQLYFELKPKVKLDEYRIDFDEETIEKLKAFDVELKEKALNLLKEPSEVVYSHIASGSFFPKYYQVLQAIKEEKADFLDFVTTLYFDSNKNVSKKTGEKEERVKILEAYGRRITETLLPFLHYLIVFGIKRKRLTAENLLTFLVQHSWIGKPHIKTDLGGNADVSNWINQIAPAIVEFYNQVFAWGESQYYSPTFILCIDSLTLKIEGLFRNFSERLNISTSKGKKKGVQEALAHDIFNNDLIKQYFNEDDMLLFDYVFSNEGGLNLRNNVAHCFYNENEYHPNKMLLLLAVLLRLAKYNVKAKV